MIGFSACQNIQSKSIDNSNIEFFDLKGYFENEIENFNHKSLKKTTSINEKEESKTITEFDIAKEMKLFTKINLKNLAWQDKFKVSQSENQEIYEALSDKLSVKSVTIDKSNGQVTKIKIISASQNLVITKDKEMIYEPNKGYSIENIQDVALVGKNNIKIEVAFID
jgi:hypothetical protein